MRMTWRKYRWEAIGWVEHASGAAGEVGFLSSVFVVDDVERFSDAAQLRLFGIRGIERDFDWMTKPQPAMPDFELSSRQYELYLRNFAAQAFEPITLQYKNNCIQYFSRIRPDLMSQNSAIKIPLWQLLMLQYIFT
jgi:hypothetical protein